MNNYAPRPGSAAAAAVEFLRKKGGPARSGEISEAIGIEAKNVMGALAAAVENGVLVACDVTVPGSAPQKEYRLSGGSTPMPWRAPKPAPSPSPSPASGRGEQKAAPAPGKPAKVQRKTAKRLPVVEVPWKEEQPAAGSLARLGHPPGTGLRFGVFNDGALEIVLADGSRVEIAAADARRLVEYLDRSLLREGA